MLDSLLWTLEDVKNDLISVINTAKMMLTPDGRYRLGELRLRKQVQEVMYPDLFIAWLDQNQRAVVGTAVQSEFCPISNYLKMNVPHLKSVATGSLDIAIMDDKSRGIFFTLPSWAEDFISHIDSEKLLAEDILGIEASEVMDGVMDRIKTYQIEEFRDDLDS